MPHMPPVRRGPPYGGATREGPDELRELLLREVLEDDELLYPRLRPDEKLARLLLELRLLVLNELRVLPALRPPPLLPPLPMFGLLAATVVRPP